MNTCIITTTQKKSLMFAWDTVVVDEGRGEEGGEGGREGGREGEWERMGEQENGGRAADLQWRLRPKHASSWRHALQCPWRICCRRNRSGYSERQRSTSLDSATKQHLGKETEEKWQCSLGRVAQENWISTYILLGSVWALRGR